MAEQLRLPLPSKPAMGREDFFISDANELAVTALTDWQNWPLSKLVLVGEAGAGKTHLAHVWAAETGARIIGIAQCADGNADDLASGPLVVEDLPQLTHSKLAQEALFHLHNLMAERNFPLLMTSETAPNHLGLPLKDLQSRLSGTSVIEIAPPDEALLHVVMMKLFADRQINPAAGLLEYALARLPRSFAAARAFVDEMDARALAEKRPIGPRLAREVLASNLDDDSENS